MLFSAKILLYLLPHIDRSIVGITFYTATRFLFKNVIPLNKRRTSAYSACEYFMNEWNYYFNMDTYIDNWYTWSFQKEPFQWKFLQNLFVACVFNEHQSISIWKISELISILGISQRKKRDAFLRHVYIGFCTKKNSKSTIYSKMIIAFKWQSRDLCSTYRGRIKRKWNLDEISNRINTYFYYQQWLS